MHCVFLFSQYYVRVVVGSPFGDPVISTSWCSCLTYFPPCEKMAPNRHQSVTKGGDQPDFSPLTALKEVSGRVGEKSVQSTESSLS